MYLLNHNVACSHVIKPTFTALEAAVRSPDRPEDMDAIPCKGAAVWQLSNWVISWRKAATAASSLSMRSVPSSSCLNASWYWQVASFLSHL
jgi:hypothetical protein